MSEVFVPLLEVDVVGTYSTSDQVIELSDVSRFPADPGPRFFITVYNFNEGSPAQAFDEGAAEIMLVISVNQGTNEISVSRGVEGTSPVTISGSGWRAFHIFGASNITTKASLPDDNTFAGTNRFNGTVRTERTGVTATQIIALQENQTAVRWVDARLSVAVSTRVVVRVQSAGDSIFDVGYIERAFHFRVTTGGTFSLAEDEQRVIGNIRDTPVEVGEMQVDGDNLIVPIRYSGSSGITFIVQVEVFAPNETVAGRFLDFSFSTLTPFTDPVDENENIVAEKTNFKRGAASDVAAVEEEDLVRLGELNTELDGKADTGGDPTQRFQVADAEEDDEAVSLGQLAVEHVDWNPEFISQSGNFTHSYGSQVGAFFRFGRIGLFRIAIGFDSGAAANTAAGEVRISTPPGITPAGGFACVIGRQGNWNVQSPVFPIAGDFTVIDSNPIIRLTVADPNVSGSQRFLNVNDMNFSSGALRNRLILACSFIISE